LLDSLLQEIVTGLAGSAAVQSSYLDPGPHQPDSLPQTLVQDVHLAAGYSLS